MPAIRGAVHDSFDQLCTLASAGGSPRICPVLRWMGFESRHKRDHEFQLNQLELLWQRRLLYGVAVDCPDATLVDERMLAWFESRRTCIVSHVSTTDHVDWIVKHLLEPFTFPVLIAPPARGAADCEAVRSAVLLLNRFEQVHLITSLFDDPRLLAETVAVHPKHILYGSGGPGPDTSRTRDSTERLEISEADRTCVMASNLERIVDGFRRRRNELLADNRDLLFPPLPSSRDEMTQQGFEVVDQARLPSEEYSDAKDYWRSYQVKSWYRRHQPWARLLAELARDLEPDSVLEFGCNVGRNLDAIAAARPGCRMVGLDINPEAIHIGRENSDLDLRLGDERSLDEFREGEFDLVFTLSVLDHIPDISNVCRALARVAARCLFCLEVTLPVEGKVLRHLDHHRGGVRESTGASYSWFVDRYFEGLPRVRRIDVRPCYLHSGSLGPYYSAYRLWLDPPS